MDADGSRLLREHGDRRLDFALHRHHQVRHLVDHDDDVRQDVSLVRRLLEGDVGALGQLQRRPLAVEVLLNNNAVRNHIRNEKLQNLPTEITLGRRQGMIALEDSLAQLVRDGLITADDARVRSSRPDELESLLRMR